MEPWQRIAMLRNEVREGRPLNPDECTIALEELEL